MLRLNTYSFTQEEIQYLQGLYNQITISAQDALVFVEKTLEYSDPKYHSSEFDNIRISVCNRARRLQVLYYQYMQDILSGKEELVVEEYPGELYHKWLELIKKEKNK